MPPKVSPDPIAFAAFTIEMNHLGFRTISRREMAVKFRRLGLKAPRQRPGQEVGFIFKAAEHAPLPQEKLRPTFSPNDLEVWAWTTWLWDKQTTRDDDEAWVVIVQGDDAPYFKGPLRRTKNFLKRLAKHAEVARCRVVNRPHCPKCNAFMNIKNGPELKDRYWRCEQKHTDNQPAAYRWDIGLRKRPDLQKFVDAERAKRKPYEDAMWAQGKNPHQAMLDRIPWRKRASRTPRNR